MRAVARHERVLATLRGKPSAALLHVDDLPEGLAQAEAEAFFDQLRAQVAQKPSPHTTDEYLAWSRGKAVSSSTRRPAVHVDDPRAPVTRRSLERLRDTGRGVTGVYNLLEVAGALSHRAPASTVRDFATHFARE